MSEPVVLESPRFAEEQARLVADPVILDMAGGLVHDPAAPKGQALLDWLESYEGMMTAYRVALSRGASFESIGGPARALTALLREEPRV